jgi:hypothetical protein
LGMPLLHPTNQQYINYLSNKVGLSAVSFTCPKSAQPHRGK